MATTFTGLRVQDTYNAILKIGDNSNLSGTAKILSDGVGNSSSIYLSTSRFGIGITPAYQFHTSGNAKIGGNLIISGNLTVNGTLTYLNVTDLQVEDPLIKLAKDNTANTLDIGLFGKYVATGTKYKGLFNDASDDKFKLFIGTSTEPTTTVDTTASGYTVGTLVANLEGNVTGGTISGTTGTFTGLVSGIAPTSDLNFATKKYVDDQTIPTPTLSSVLSAGNSSGASDLKIIDDQKLLLGDNGDMQIYHNQVNSVFFNDTGNIVFRNNANDSDISFQTDDGQGYTTEYMRIDGGTENIVFSKPISGTTGTFIGGMSSFETVLGGTTNNDDWQNSPISILERGNVQGTETADKYAPNLNFHWGDKYSASLWMDVSGALHYGRYSGAGTPSTDGKIKAANFIGALTGNVTGGTISGTTGNFTGLVTGIAPTSDLNFATKKYVDDQTVPTPTLSSVLGAGNTSGTNDLIIQDNDELVLGSSTDFRAYHNETNTLFRINTGDLIFNSFVDDGNIKFQLDDGSDPAGLTEYMRLDGGEQRIIYGRSPLIVDNLKLYFGNDTSNDASIRWDSTASQLFIDGTSKFLDDVIMVSSGLAASPTLAINNPASSAFVHSIEAFAANVTSGQTNLIVVGESASSKNSGYIGYNWDSDASDSNYVSIGHWGVDHLIKVYASGSVNFVGTIISTKDGTALEMDGGSSAEGIRLQADSSTTYPVFLRSVNPSSGESSPWLYQENTPSWGIWHNNPINSFDFTRSGSQSGAIATDVGGETNSVMIRLNNTDGSGTFVGGVTAPSFSGNLTGNVTGNVTGSASLNVLKAGDTMTGTLQINSNDSGEGDNLKIYSTTQHQYPQIFSDSTREAMWNYKNDTATWYVGIRNSLQLIGAKSAFAFYNTTDGATVGGYSTAGDHYAKNSSRSKIFYDLDNVNFYYDPATGSVQQYTYNVSGTSGNYGSQIIVGQTSVNLPYTLQDSNHRPVLAATGNYPVLHLNHTSNTNTNHGPTIQFTHNGVTDDRQWVIGSTGDGISLDIGFSSDDYYATGNDYNPHNGISGYRGKTYMRFRENGNIGLGASNGGWGGISGGNPAYAIDTKGTLYNNTDVRAPIFYAHDDINYYLDPASTSASLNVAGSATFGGDVYGKSVNAAYSQLYRFGGIFFTWDSDTYGTDFYHSITSTHNGVYGDNITMNSYGKVRINFDSNNNDSADFSIGTHTTGASNTLLALDSAGSCIVVGDVRSPVFYDSNNTAYYGYFASASRMSRINGGNGDNPAFVCVANASYGAGTELEIGGWSTTTTVSKIRNSNGNLHIDSKQGNDIYLQHYPTGNVRIGGGGGYLLSYNSVRSPIFYDSDDTGYYLDPNSTNISLNVAGRIQTSSTGLAASPAFEINCPSSSAFIHTAEVFTPNMTSGQTNLFGIGKSGSTRQTGYVGYYWSANASNNNFISLGHWGVDHLFRVYGDVITSQVSFRGSADVRGTIFYDTNDTSYYVNPNAGSEIYDLKLKGANHKYLEIDPTGNYESMVRYMGASGGDWYVGKRTSTSSSSNSGISTSDYHFYSVTSGKTVGGVTSNGGIHAQYFGFTVGDPAATYTYNDTTTRSKVYVSSQYPVMTINCSTNTNSNHGGTLQFVASGYDSNAQWVIGSGGTCQFLDFGFGQPSNKNPHVGISGYQGKTMMRMIKSGKVGIGGNWGTYGSGNPSYDLDVLGTIRASSDVIAFSDKRVKENIKTIDNALDKVTKLRGVTYTRKDIEDKSTKVGVIAQEVLEILPEVVNQDDKGMYSVAYGNIVGVLIEAVKEQQKQINELTNIIDKLNK